MAENQEPIDRLNQEVTAAIKLAEELEDAGSTAAKDAYSQVSELEEQIAGLTEWSSLEGQIARRGAISAAIKAIQPGRAKLLSRRFIDEVDEIISSATKLKTELASLVS